MISAASLEQEGHSPSSVGSSPFLKAEEFAHPLIRPQGERPAGSRPTTAHVAVSAVLDERLALFNGLNVIPKRSFLTEHS